MNPHYYLVIGLILHSIISSSQPYRTIFLSDTTSWNVYECAPDAGGTIQYFSHDDTIINTHNYYKLFRKNINNFSGYSGTYICGYVREDTITGKYWFLKIEDDEYHEALFMDFSLNQGDSFGFISDFRFMWVDSSIVDTIFYDDGRKIIELDYIYYACLNEYKIIFIEGIGASNGFYMGEYNEQPHSYSLLCKFENGTKIYSTSSNIYGNCILDPGGGISQNELNINILVYPNPSSSLVSIEIDDWQKEMLKYEFYNLLGQKIKAGYIKSFKTDFKFQTDGFYYLVISDEYNIKTKKIVINGN